MKPLNMKAFILMACTLGSPIDTSAVNLAEETSLRAWLRENSTMVDAQFQFIDLPIEARYDQEVAWHIERYLRPGRRETERMLGRAAYYLPIFERTLRAYGLPETLKYLPIVESGLFPRIESPAGAVGLWQFMGQTARHFDLRVDQWVDERCDPVRATDAAARLLVYLHEEFGDWNLALVAYNCGPGRVRAAMRRAGSSRYQTIRPYLPEQTQRYIAKYKAAAFVAVFHDFFGVNPRPSRHLVPDADAVTLPGAMSFAEIARLAGMSVTGVRMLNPAFRQDAVPAGAGYRTILLPPAAAETLAAALRPDAAGRPVAEKEQEVVPEPVGMHNAALPAKPSATPPVQGEVLTEHAAGRIPAPVRRREEDEQAEPAMAIFPRELAGNEYTIAPSKDI